MGTGVRGRCAECAHGVKVLTAPLAITAHFWFLGKDVASIVASNPHSHFMKSRFSLRLLFPLLAIPLFSLSAQNQTSPLVGNPASTLQIQDNLTSSAPASVQADQPAPSVPAATVPDVQAVTPVPPEQVPAVAPVTPDPAAPPANSGQGTSGENPPASDPNSLIPPPAEPEQPSPINAAGNEEKQRQDQKSRYYTAKVKADKEEGLASLLQKSEKAKSDEAKRQALREYYDLLAKRMKKIDPSLSEWVDTMHAAYLRRIAQVRLEPTIPVNVPPASDASAAATLEKKSQSATADQTPVPKKKKRSTSNN